MGASCSSAAAAGPVEFDPSWDPVPAQRPIERNSNDDPMDDLLDGEDFDPHALFTTYLMAAAMERSAQEASERNNDDNDRLRRWPRVFRRRPGNAQVLSDLEFLFERFSGPQSSEIASLLMLTQVEALREANNNITNNNTNALCPPASKRAIRNLKRVRACQEGRECFVCWEDLSGCTVCELPCGHGFHQECIESWLRRQCTCPTCRYEVPTDDPIYELGRMERMKQREKNKVKQLDRQQDVADAVADNAPRNDQADAILLEDQASSSRPDEIDL